MPIEGYLNALAKPWQTLAKKKEVYFSVREDNRIKEMAAYCWLGVLNSLNGGAPVMLKSVSYLVVTNQERLVSDVLCL